MDNQSAYEMDSESESFLFQEERCLALTKREKYQKIATVILVLSFIGLLTAVIFLASKPKPTKSKPVEMPCVEKSCLKAEMPCVEKSCLKAAIYITDKRDTSYKPCDNFYMYSCANYMKNHVPLSDTDPKQVKVMLEMAETTNREVLTLLHEKDTDKTIEPVKKVRNFFRSCMEEDTLDATIMNNAMDLAEKVDGIPMVTGNSSKGDHVDILVKFATVTGFYPFLYISSVSNVYDDSGPMLYLSFDGFDDLNDTIDFAIILAEKFNNSIGFNEVDVRKFYNELIKIEKYSPEFKARDLGIIKRRNISEVNVLMGDFDIKRYLNGILEIGGAELKEDTIILFTRKERLINLKNLINNTDPGVLMNIAFIEFFNKFRPILSHGPKPVVEIPRWYFFRLIPREIWETLQITNYERAKRCLEICQSFDGHVIGKMYVDTFYSDSIKKQVETVTGYIRKALPNFLEKEEWLDKSTREAAVKKTTYALDNNLYIGYSPHLYNVTVLTENLKPVTVTDEFLSNYIAFSKRSTELYMKLFIKDPSVKNSVTEASVLKVHYDIMYNSIGIPLAILQAPVFQVNAPLVLNFGGIGTIVGHELMHAFSTSGLFMNYLGKYKPWMSRSTASKYEKRKRDMMDQYSKYKIKSLGKYVNGNLTIEENMADNGGIKLAYMAYKLWRKDNPNVKLELPGVDLSEDQLFFTAFAQILCSNLHVDVLSENVRTDGQSPSEARVQVSMMNSKYFSETFNCSAGATMNPKEKVSVW